MFIEEFREKNNLKRFKDLDCILGNVEVNFLVGDIESHLDEDGQWIFVMMVISDGYNLYEFRTIDEVIEFFRDYGVLINIYFHNLDFDMLFFFREELFKNGMENMDIIASGNMTISFKWENVVFKNSLSLFPMGLKQLVKKFLHVNDEEWFNDKSNVLDLEDEVLLNYCMKDVYYLHCALVKYRNYFKDNFEIDLTLTTPSLALKLWKKHFNPDSEFISLPRRNKFFDDNYYFGGHTEKFINDIKVFRNVNYYDVNSLYPSEMLDSKFINCKLKRTVPTIRNVKSLIKRGVLFYCEVTINVDSEALRFFPVLDEVNKVNLYPTGKFKVKLSEVGINFILTHGSWENIVEFHHVLIGEENLIIKPFEKFVSTFYELRKSDSGNDVIFKLLLNSLYGKFGQKVIRDCKVINSTRETPPKSMVNNNGFCVSTYEEETKFHSLGTARLDVAGKITEMARLSMGDKINAIREEFGDDSVIYTDTDSIITFADLKTSSKLSVLLDDNKLGFLGDEIGHKDNMICLGQKMYHFYKSGKKATKGVKKMGLDDFRGLIRGKNKFENQRFSRFNSLINKGFFGIMTVPFELKNIRERLDV